MYLIRFNSIVCKLSLNNLLNNQSKQFFFFISFDIFKMSVEKSWTTVLLYTVHINIANVHKVHMLGIL